MKRKIFVISLFVIMLAIISAGSYAYFTAEYTAHNVITSGTIDIKLEEWAVNPDPTGEELIPFEDVIGVMPGAVVSKIAAVRNIGTADAWIRAEVTVTLTRSDGTTEEVDPAFITLDYNTEDWTLIDGLWYCKTAPAPNDVTEPLFTTVTFDADMDNRYQNSTVAIDVLVQATQKIHNGVTVEEAKGWPKD